MNCIVYINSVPKHFIFLKATIQEGFALHETQV